MNLLHCTVPQRPQGRKRTSVSDYKLLKCQAEGMCHLYLQFVSRWCKTRKRQRIQSCMGCLLHAGTWETTKTRLNPTELLGHLFSANANKLLHKHFFSLSSSHCLNLILEGFPLLLSQFHESSLRDYSPSCAVTGGCQQATTADTDGSPCLWWLPYVTSLSWVKAFLMFSFHLSSLSLFCSLKQLEQGGRRMSQRLRRVKMWCPLIHFMVGIQFKL